MLGPPEGVLALAECVVYLALSPKSNRLYLAETAALSEIRESGPFPPPLTIRNAPTRLMKDLDYGKGYRYDHDEAEAFSGQDYFPAGVKKREYYMPGRYGFEIELEKRRRFLEELKRKKGL